MRIVPLYRPAGYFTVVSDVDAEWVAGLCLRYHLAERRTATPWGRVLAGYVQHGRRSALHRTILERAGIPIDGLVTDHRSGWGLDNRRENLRTMTPPMMAALRRDQWRGIFERHDVDPVTKCLRATTHYAAYHRHRKLGDFPTHEAALAAKVAAEAADGYPATEDRAALLAPVIEFLEQCVTDGILRRHVTGAPMIEDQYRVR
jgi:hypothetical protein